MIVVAKDENCREWEKTVTFRASTYGTIIDFGWPCSYYLSDIMRRLPFDRGLCIDAGGMNHAMSPVWISKEDINRLLQEWLDEMITDKENIS